MAYSELIKDFDKIRKYMTQFYVYGFKSRNEYDEKSPRTYDDARRRIESWLDRYMSFRQDKCGNKITYLTIDSREISSNPLYEAFKTKSFTSNDVMLYFYILDILSDFKYKTVNEIVIELEKEYFFFFEESEAISSENSKLPSRSTIEKKIKEYERLGLLESSKRGREILYKKSESNIDVQSWKDVIAFYTEADPLGVIGSFLSDQSKDIPEYYQFKHHYILHALESDVLYSLLLAMAKKRYVKLLLHSQKQNAPEEAVVLPMRIYVSTQSGRRYLIAWNMELNQISICRLDYIENVTQLNESYSNKELEEKLKATQYLWGVSYNGQKRTEHFEMRIFVDDGEEYIVNRLKRERRQGVLKKIDNNIYKYEVNVYDALELLPWIRTFIGRIVDIKCSNEEFVSRFKEDFELTMKLYEQGGDENAL